MTIKVSPNLILLFFILFLTSCAIDQTVQLRIKNTSTFTYDSILVNTSGSTNTYGTIVADSTSDYKTYDYAYSYAYISLYIDTVNYQLIPIDYVGETKLPSGNFTYEVSVSDTVNHLLAINLVVD